MNGQISSMIADYEQGKISRRQLVAGLGTLMAVFGAPAVSLAQRQDAETPAVPPKPTFQTTGLNHLALQVSNVPRSRDFYVKHLGLKVTRDGGERNRFLDCGKHFVALFRSDTPQMDHYCYSVDHYDVDQCEATLKSVGLEPRVVRPDGRIYFKDPDGLTVQLAQTPK